MTARKGVAVEHPTQWQVAGSAPENYERYLVPAIFGPFAADLVESAAMRPGERVLDVACGPGVVARRAAEAVGAEGRVVGLDLNAGMLAVARALPPAAGAPVEWQEGDATALPLADGAFDVALCQQGLQFFPDRPAALREMRRVLNRAGRVALSTWRGIGHSPGFAALAAALARHVPAAVATIRGLFALGDADELRALVIGAGFRDVAIRPLARTPRFPSAEEFVRRYVAGSPLAEPVGQADDAARAAVLRDVATALAPAGGEAAFPIETHLTLALA
jgi:SAM-dependent methyltransferase